MTKKAGAQTQGCQLFLSQDRSEEFLWSVFFVASKGPVFSIAIGKGIFVEIWD